MKTYTSFNMKAIIRLASVVLIMIMGVGNVWGTTTNETITFSSATSSTSGSGNTYTITWTSGTSCNINAAKGSGNQVYSSTTAPRWYQNNLITFTPKSGYRITQIVINATSSKHGGTMTFNSGYGWGSISTNTSTGVSTITVAGGCENPIVIKPGSTCYPSSVVITYTDDDLCDAVDVTGGSAIILPNGSETYTGGDWKGQGAPANYQQVVTQGKISTNEYCVSFYNAADNGTLNNGLHFKASSGYIEISGITSSCGVDVKILGVSGSNGFKVQLTGASDLTGQTGTVNISTTSTSATLKIYKNTATEGYIKTITITPKSPCASCSTDPTVGAASLNGSFSLSSVGVRCPTSGTAVQSNCSWEDYGFVWGTSNSGTRPDLTSDASNKVQTGTSGTGNTWDDALEGSFSTGVTYYYRAYGQNGHGLAYGTVASFTPFKVYYNANGGTGTIADQIVNTGGSVTLSDGTGFSKTGYHITKWALGSAGGTQSNPSSSSGSVTANKEYYAIWEANTYVITLNANTGSGSSPASVNATYNAHALSSAITNPTKTDYIFEGWNTKADGSGLTVIGTDGELIADVSGYTDEDGNWTKAETETLYAKWTEHTYTNYRTVCSSTYNVTYDGNGNTDGSVPTDNTDYDSGDEVTVLGNSGSLVKTHYAFDGWNTKADGSGDPYAEDETFEITKNTTLYAQWACDENITISAGTPTNGSFTLSSTGDVETCSDDVVITVTPSPNTGYNFSAITQTGLNSGVTINQSDKTVTYDQYSSGTTTINVTFVAKTTTVTLNKNGATSGTNQTVSATYGLAMPTTTTSSAALVAPTKNGYTLMGYWDTDATTGGKQYYDANMTSVTSWDKEDATVTLYARWEAKVDRFIDDMHETSGYTSAAPHEESGASYTMPGPLSNTTPGGDCVTAHYIFVGWVLSTGQNSNGTLKDSGSRIYRPGETIHATNATYYAVWAEE